MNGELNFLSGQKKKSLLKRSVLRKSPS